MTRAISLFGKHRPGVSSCFPEAPDLNGCDPCCEPKCEPRCCAPKTRARDAIKMKPRETARKFVLNELGCNPARIPMVVNRISMTLRRRGHCDEMACIPPDSSDLDGSVTFAWPKVFRDAPAGQYEGDVFINGCEVGSVFLLKPDSGASIESDEEVQADWPCAGCGECLVACRCGPGCAAVPDLVEPPYHAGDSCGGCDPC